MANDAWRRPPWKDTTVITPHLGYVTRETYRIFFGHAIENIASFLRGAPVRVIEPT